MLSNDMTYLAHLGSMLAPSSKDRTHLLSHTLYFVRKTRMSLSTMRLTIENSVLRYRMRESWGYTEAGWTEGISLHCVVYLTYRMVQLRLSPVTIQLKMSMMMKKRMRTLERSESRYICTVIYKFWVRNCWSLWSACSINRGTCTRPAYSQPAKQISLRRPSLPIWPLLSFRSHCQACPSYPQTPSNLGSCNGMRSEHFVLTHLLILGNLQEADTLGVDIEHPPNSKIFDPTDRSDDEDDISALAWRQRAQLAGRNHNNQSNITVNFMGLAELIWPSSPSKNPSGNIKTNLKAIPPKLNLQSFTTWIGLSVQLCNKLEAIYLDGPHLLRLVSNEQLRAEGGLSLGELTVLWDAEERWKEGHESWLYPIHELNHYCTLSANLCLHNCIWSYYM